MPIRPDDASILAKEVRQIFADAEILLLQRLAKALAAGVDEPGWVQEKLLAVQVVRRQLDAVLRDLDEAAPGAVERAIEFAYNQGIATAAGELTNAGLGAAAFEVVQPTGAVFAFASATLERVVPMTFQIGRVVNDAYRDVINQVSTQVAAGVLTRREAARLALTRLTENGITGFRDASGRRWDMASYAEMATRTGAAQAMLQGHTDRIRELGIDLVMVSDAPEECSICRPFEGQVLSVSGARNDEVLSDGVTVKTSLPLARAAGLYHPNCRHSHTIYLPGITKRLTDTEDPEGDKLRQQQRAYERRIRELKRRDAIDHEFGGPKATASRAALRAKQSEFKAWREANGRKNLAYRTSLTSR
jgi:hypothetical protein